MENKKKLEKKESILYKIVFIILSLFIIFIGGFLAICGGMMMVFSIELIWLSIAFFILGGILLWNGIPLLIKILTNKK